MGLLGKLFSKKPKGHRDQQMSRKERAVMSKVMKKAPSSEAEAEADRLRDTGQLYEQDRDLGINIWDMADDGDSGDSAAPAAKTPRPRRRVRNKTRILGSDPADANIAAAADNSDNSQSPMSMNPTGWLIVVDGPGRGAAFALFAGMASIGRGADQTIPLDFGDMTMSRDNHASIAYDSTDHTFYFGQGGKSNLVRVNGKPVLSTEAVKDGDEFLIGETTLRLKALCSAEFNWEETSEGDEYVAIA